jgi:diguanylate cyclase
MNLPRILIVDDEEEVLRSYRSILERKNEISEIETLGESIFNDSEEISLTEEEAEYFTNDSADLIVEEGLQTDSYEIVEATQGMDAVRIIEKSLNEKQPFSLMFLDIRMPPGIDGVETARLIRQLDPSIEIVIMTAYSDYKFEEIVKTIGNPDRLLYFYKPFKSAQINQLASSLTQQWYLEKKSLEQE